MLTTLVPKSLSPEGGCLKASGLGAASGVGSLHCQTHPGLKLCETNSRHYDYPAGGWQL